MLPLSHFLPLSCPAASPLLCPRSFFIQLLELAVGSFQFRVINHLAGSRLASPQQTHNKPPLSTARHSCLGLLFFYMLHYKCIYFVISSRPDRQWVLFSRDDAGRFVPMCCLLLLTKPLVWMFPQYLLFHESIGVCWWNFHPFAQPVSASAHFSHLLKNFPLCGDP